MNDRDARVEAAAEAIRCVIEAPNDSGLADAEIDLLAAHAALAAADAVQGERFYGGGQYVPIAEVQPTDDRRMVDLDAVLVFLRRTAPPFWQGAGLASVLEREFGGSAPSEETRGDWRCECGDLNRDCETFCYRCGAGSPEGR